MHFEDILADGWHMATHAAALGVAIFAYVYARKHAADPRYSFGTGKVGALGGFASAVGLAVVALLVLVESAARRATPVSIRFDEAIAVAFLGLAVNLACALLLHEHDHPREHEPFASPSEDAANLHRDHNLRAAFLHVLADAMTMGIVGAIVISRWSLGLLRDTSAVLLDAEVSTGRDAVRAALELEGDRVASTCGESARGTSRCSRRSSLPRPGHPNTTGAVSTRSGICHTSQSRSIRATGFRSAQPKSRTDRHAPESLIGLVRNTQLSELRTAQARTRGF